jgi:hypothetical protein
VVSAFTMALVNLLTCVAQQIRVDIQFNREYKMTHIHSKYEYEPKQLPSFQIISKLNNSTWIKIEISFSIACTKN